MVATDKLFAGSIPEIYDRFLVPLIFEPYAADLAGRVAALAPSDVLETAAGTGVLTRALAERLSPSAHLIATDLNQPMIDQAARRQPAGTAGWKQADALALPFADGSFDVVACQFGVMFFPDKARGYAEIRRVLAPQGAFVFNAWDRIEDNEFAADATDAAATIFPDDPPRFLARVPHGYCDTTRIRNDLAAGGFANAPSIESVELRSRAESARHAALGFCHGTPLRNEIDARDASRLADVVDAATAAIARRFGNGIVDGKMLANVVTIRR